MNDLFIFRIITLAKMEQIHDQKKRPSLWKKASEGASLLDIVDSLSKAVPFLFAGLDVVELNVIVVTFLAECNGLVDLHGLGELAVRLQISSLVGGVLQDNVGLAILIVTKTNLKKGQRKDNENLILNHEHVSQIERTRTNSRDIFVGARNV